MPVTNNTNDLSQTWEDIYDLYNRTGLTSELIDFLEWLEMNYEPPKNKIKYDT